MSWSPGRSLPLARRMADAFHAHGPMAACHLATTVRTRRDVVDAELERNAMFIHNGRKARASRWDVCDERDDDDKAPTFTVEELAARWGDDLAMGRLFVRDFLAAGYLESVNGNGQVRVSELGLRLSNFVNGAKR